MSIYIRGGISQGGTTQHVLFFVTQPVTPTDVGRMGEEKEKKAMFNTKHFVDKGNEVTKTILNSTSQ
jgi:hypothetical protein